MKRLISAFLTIFIIISSFSITSYASTPDYENIKIGLHFGSGAKNSVVLNCDSGFELGYEDNDGLFVLISGLIETQITVSVSEEGKLQVEGIYVNEEFPNLCINPGYGNLQLDGADYRGSMIFAKDSANLMTVINKVNLEEYLYSVLGREMSPSWPLEALKAQAICARTYAINNWKRYSSYGFNLDNTQNTQVYSGMSAEGPSTIQAVEETRGLIVMYDGKAAQTFYYSANGGKTANVKYVWTSEIPYLVSVDDPFENPETVPNYNWTVELSKEEIKERLQKRNVDIGEVVSVEAVGVDNGTVYDVKITGENGDYHVTKDGIRGFFGIKSQYFTIKAPGDVTTYPTVTIIGSNGLSTTSTNNISIYNGSAQDNLYVLSSGGLTTYEANVQTGSDNYVFNGHGWGHRIGMSQWGAKCMADIGYNSTDILTHYFPGVTVDSSLLGTNKAEITEDIQELD